MAKAPPSYVTRHVTINGSEHMGRRPINDKAMTDTERQRRSRAKRGKAPNVTSVVTEDDVIEYAAQAGPEALEALWQREYDKAVQAIVMLDLIFKRHGRISKYAKGKYDPQDSIDTAWDAIFEDLEGRVVFRDKE